jgi:hypothetical protein
MSDSLPSLRAVDPSTRPILDVFDLAYRLGPVTRSVQKELHKAQTEIERLMDDPEEDGDKIVAQIASILDALLKPEGNNTIPAKKLVVDKWKADELDVAALQQFSRDLQEQAANASRPT